MLKQAKTAAAAALLSAALCTGCGDSVSNRAADAGTTETAVRTTVTERTTVTDGTTRTTVHETTAETGLIDRAEDALDSVGDAITSVLTKATSQIHNHTETTTTTR